KLLGAYTKRMPRIISSVFPEFAEESAFSADASLAASCGFLPSPGKSYTVRSAREQVDGDRCGAATHPVPIVHARIVLESNRGLRAAGGAAISGCCSPAGHRCWGG